MMAGLGNNQTIVCDYGSRMAQAGFAGDDAPIAVFPSIVGRPKEVNSGLNKEYFVGNQAQANRDRLTLQYPIEDNLINNWDDMEKIWHHTFYSLLHVAPIEHPVLLTESVLNPIPHREKLAQIMFEKFATPAMYLAAQPPLHLYSTGRTTGVVMEIGDGVSPVVPVYEGRIKHDGIKRLDVAGHDLTEYLINFITKGRHTCSSAERELIQDIKEKTCYVALDYEEQLAKCKTSVQYYRSYELPDGYVFLGPERFKVPEALFQPSLAGKKTAGIHEVTHKSVMASDVEIRRELYNNIVVAGGATMFPGIAERMTKEINVLAPNDVVVKAVAPKEKSSAWIGGSIMASLSSFVQIMITKDEYEDHGARIVNTKCF